MSMPLGSCAHFGQWKPASPELGPANRSVTFIYRILISKFRLYSLTASTRTVKHMPRMDDVPQCGGPFTPLSKAITRTCEELGTNWQCIGRIVEHHKRQIHTNASKFLSHVGHVAGDHLKRIQESQQRQQALAGMAVSTSALPDCQIASN